MHFTFIATALLAAAPTALGHGWILEPTTIYANGASWNNMWGSTLRDDALGPKNFYEIQGALKYIDDNLHKQYKSVRDLLQVKQDVVPGADPQCGWTRLDEARRVTLPPRIKFTPFIHPGPCEFYCDNTLVQSDRDCMSKWPDGNIPIDVSKCVGANRFSMYWLTVHTPPWQVYSYCVYLKGGSGGPNPGPPGPPPQINPQPANPQPAHQPNPQPAPQPNPQPAPQPAPQPNPQPAPQPNPQPAPPKKCEYKKKLRV